MKLLTIIKNLIKITRKKEPAVKASVPRLTLQEYAYLHDFSIGALRGRISRREKTCAPEDRPILMLVDTKAGMRPTKLYPVAYLERVMPPKANPPSEEEMVQAGTDHKRISQLIYSSYCKGDKDLLDFWHCPSHRCDQEICKSCLRNLGNFPKGTVGTISNQEVRREGDRCSAYCGLLASAHARHVLY
jgi:hypothetical protein